MKEDTKKEEAKKDPLYEVRDAQFDKVLERQRAHYTSKLEPFETFAKRKKAEMHHIVQERIQHLTNGYNLIIEMIKSEAKVQK
jgi:hypothetical protein